MTAGRATSQPETTVLYEVVRDNLERLVAVEGPVRSGGFPSGSL